MNDSDSNNTVKSKSTPTTSTKLHKVKKTKQHKSSLQLPVYYKLKA